MGKAQDAEVVCLSTIAGGAADTIFDEKLIEVLRNIADEGTDPEKVREINLRFRFYPSEDRKYGSVVVFAQTKLAPRPSGSTLYFGSIDKRPVAVEHDPRQTGLFDDNTATVVALKGGKEA